MPLKLRLRKKKTSNYSIYTIDHTLYAENVRSIHGQITSAIATINSKINKAIKAGETIQLQLSGHGGRRIVRFAPREYEDHTLEWESEE